MFICPHCQSRLNKVVGEVGRFWSCPVCNGRAVTLPVLQKVAPQKLLNQLWQDARSGTDVGDRACPACDRKMRRHPRQLPYRLNKMSSCMITRKMLSLPSQDRGGGGGRTLILSFLKLPAISRNPALSHVKTVRS